MKRLFGLILLVILLQSCDYFTFKSDNRIPIARVHDTYLYKEDINHIFNKDISREDSLQVARNYINNWVKQQLLLSKAQLNLTDRSSEFEELISTYRKDLYINSYKEAVVQEYLNTNISEDDIDDFYRNNNQNFKLNEELIKMKFIKLSKDVLNSDELIELFKSSKRADLDSLQAKELFLNSHHLNDSIWVKYSELLSVAPIFKSEAKGQLLKNNNFIQKEDSLSLYLVAIKDVLERNEIAPKSYVVPTIRQMILHQRKLLLMRNIEESLMDDANKDENFEIY